MCHSTLDEDTLMCLYDWFTLVFQAFTLKASGFEALPRLPYESSLVDTLL